MKRPFRTLAAVVVAMALACPSSTHAQWNPSKPQTGGALVSSDIRGNWAALEKTVGNIDLLSNPTFLRWDAGNSAAPAYWVLAGAGAAVVRAGTGFGDTSRKVGMNTAKVTSASATATLEQELFATVDYDDGFDGRAASGCGWVRATASSVARLYVADGAGTTFSGFHTGGGTYEWLCASRTVDAAATKLAFGLEVATGTKTGYLSGATVLLGQVAPTDYLPPLRTPVLAANTTTVGNVGVGEDDLMSYSVPANVLNTGKLLTFSAHGSFAGNANSKTIRFRFGATAFTIINATVQSGGGWVAQVRVYRDSATTQRVSWVAVRSAGGGAAGEGASFAGRGTAAETLSAAVIGKFTADATADNDVQQEVMLVEVIG